jgi:hypothetical protein
MGALYFGESGYRSIELGELATNKLTALRMIVKSSLHSYRELSNRTGSPGLALEPRGV